LPSLVDYQITRAEELTIHVPLATLGVDPAFVAAHRDQLAPYFLSEGDSSFPFVFQSWIVHAGGLTIVVDPCNGNGRERPTLPPAHRLDTPFLERFEATGTRPEDVDIVFCTHLHCDHCGWNTRLRGGRWVPTFPNARYLFQRREVERWDPRNGFPAVDYNVGVFEDSVQPVIDAGLAELIDGRHVLRPGIEIQPAPGHTLAHAILRLALPETAIYFTGDVFHHPLQVIDTRLNLPGGDDDATGDATRLRLARTIAEENAIMVPAHFPAPHAGRIEQDARGRRFVALEG
jgi:glyoxylase-like metal-dependent hydrolase (beta-lactamase superfamily II)